MAGITTELANQLTEYKTRERHARRLTANALGLFLGAQQARAELESATMPGEELELAREFYESQLKANPGAVEVFDQIESHITEIHRLMWLLQSVDPSIFAGMPEPRDDL